MRSLLIAVLSISCIAAATPVLAANGRAPVDGTDIQMSPKNMIGFKHDLLRESRQFPFIKGNVAKMAAQCLAAGQTTGLCPIFEQLVREQHWASSDQHGS
jgi:hypothetical protein